MTEALRLAERGRYGVHPNPCVGCVVVRDGQVVGRGWHQRAGQPHAEVIALAQAGALSCGATVYVTLEPCAHRGRTGPCTEALLAAGVRRVVIAARDPNPKVCGGGLEHLVAAGVTVEQGVLEDAARRQNRGFMQRAESGRPWVCVKLAFSLDGRTAHAPGSTDVITSASSRRDVQDLRARSSFLLTGRGTVVADNPRLDVRADELGFTPPRQVSLAILDSELVLSPQAKALSSARPVVIFYRENRSSTGTWPAHVELCPVRVDQDQRLDLHQVLAQLAERECNDLLVEAGPTLAGSLLQANLIDELICYLSPTVIGPQGQQLFNVPTVTHMRDRYGFKLVDTRMVGADLRMTLVPQRD